MNECMYTWILYNSRDDARRHEAHLHQVLEAVQHEDLDVFVLRRHEYGFEGTQEEPLEVEVSQLLLEHKLEGQLLQRVHGIFSNLWPKFGQTRITRHET